MGRTKIKEIIMIYYKDTNNEPYAFEDNVTAEIITKVEATHKTTLTKITLADYEAIIVPTPLQKKAAHNNLIYSQISKLEITLARPMRELLSSTVLDKTFAQKKVNDIDAQIQALRLQIQV